MLLTNKKFKCAHCDKIRRHTWYTLDSPVVTQKEEKTKLWFVCDNKCLFKVLEIFRTHPDKHRNIAIVSAK